MFYVSRLKRIKFRHIYYCSGFVHEEIYGLICYGTMGSQSTNVFSKSNHWAIRLHPKNEPGLEVSFVCKVVGHLNETAVRNLFNSWALSKPQLTFRRCWATSPPTDVPCFLCVLLHVHYRPSVFFPVAFRELVFALLLIKLNSLVYRPPMLVNWQIWNC